MDHDDLMPLNQVRPETQVVGLYRLEAREAAAQVKPGGDLELDLQIYGDGSADLGNGRDYDERNRVRLSPSQLAQLRNLMKHPTAVPPYRPEETD